MRGREREEERGERERGEREGEWKGGRAVVHSQNCDKMLLQGLQVA